MGKLSKVHLISFCHIFKDAPLHLSEELINSKVKFFNKSIDKFDSVTIWSGEKFKHEFPGAEFFLADYYDTYRDECFKLSLNINKDWLHAGCFMWKPQLLNFALEKICDEGDILIYHDINLLRYPKYSHNLTLGKNFYRKKLNNQSVLLFMDNNRPLFFDCKHWLLEKYLFDYFDYGQHLQNFWAGLICVKNDEIGRKFIEIWSKMSTLDNCAPLPDVSMNRRHPKFIWHSQEQSTLAITYYTSRKLFHNSINILLAPGRKVFSFKHSNLKDFFSYLHLSCNLFMQLVLRKFHIFMNVKHKENNIDRVM